MLLLASSVCGLFKWRQFEPEVILLAVGWYRLHADHVTVWRWIQRYAPEMERRLRSRLRPTNDSWRVDETYIRVKGKWVYLYRAVDFTGATIDFLLSAKRDTVAAKRFLTKALDGKNHPAPRVINTDKDAAYPPAIVLIRAEAALEENCHHRPVNSTFAMAMSPEHCSTPTSQISTPRIIPRSSTRRSGMQPMFWFSITSPI
jgi:transposase-like protein